MPSPSLIRQRIRVHHMWGSPPKHQDSVSSGSNFIGRLSIFFIKTYFVIFCLYISVCEPMEWGLVDIPCEAYSGWRRQPVAANKRKGKKQARVSNLCNFVTI